MIKIHPVILVALVFFVILCTGSLSRRLLYHPARLDPARRAYISRQLPHVTELTLPAGKKVSLHGWLIRKDLGTLPTVLYFGGNAEEVSYNIEAFNRHLDANVLLMNYRGYGLSTGSPNEKDLKADSEQIYDYLIKEMNVDPERIIVCGRSLGTGIAVHLAVMQQIRRLVLISPYDSIERVAARSFPRILVRFFLTDRYRAIDEAARVTAKTLIFIAGNDRVIPPENSRALTQALVCETEVVQIDRAHHNNLTEFDEYREALSRFTIGEVL